MGGVSAFWTAYSARRGDERVEAIVVIVDGTGSTASVSFVVVDERGQASIARADELDLYGVRDESYGESEAASPQQPNSVT